MFAKLSYYAHSAQNKLGNLLPYEHWQTLQSHSVNVGEMAAEFAQVFGAQEIAYLTGQLHDLGKYSELFDRRLHGALQSIMLLLQRHHMYCHQSYLYASDSVNSFLDVLLFIQIVFTYFKKLHDLKDKELDDKQILKMHRSVRQGLLNYY